MSSQISWHCENRVLYVQLAGNITPEMLLKNCEYVASLLDVVTSERVHVIMDMQRVVSLPKETGTLRNMFAPLLSHEKLGWTVVMTGNLMLQSILNRTVHRLTEKWGYVGSMPEAADLLRRADSKLWTMPSNIQRNAVLHFIK